jgi:ADP-heptose:LPS heptosyltransferase
MLVNVGDVIMMTSALDLIRQKMPNTRLAVLARPEAAELLRGNPVLDDLIIYPYKSGSPFHGLGDLLRTIRAGKFEVFLSLDRRPRGAMAACLAGIKTRIGPNILFAGAKPKLWTRFLFTRQISMSAEECRGSLVEMFQLVARRGLNIAGKGRVTLPPVTGERAEWVRGHFAQAGGPIIGLCVRTNDPGKTWPRPKFADLMGRLHRDFGAFLYVTGGPGDAEYVNELIGTLDGVPVLNLAGQTSLMDIPALAAQSDLCITLDNGTAHLMAASGQPNLICILIATTPKILIDSMPQAKFISFNPQNPAPDSAVYQAARLMIGGKNE